MLFRRRVCVEIPFVSDSGLHAHFHQLPNLFPRHPVHCEAIMVVSGDIRSPLFPRQIENLSRILATIAKPTDHDLHCTYPPPLRLNETSSLHGEIAPVPTCHGPERCLHRATLSTAHRV